MGRKFPLTTSFLGFPLKTGAIISGVYGIVIAIVTLLIILICDIRIQTIVIDFLPKAVVQIIVSINLLMTVLISVLLLVGIFKRKKILMLPWIVLTIMLCIGLVISVIYTSIDFLIHKFYFTSFGVLVIGLLCVGIYVYMWWVTYSYYQKIKEEDNRTPYTRTPYYG
ncbi:uncharacterized protein LOC132938290 [Metopolophium dirhodum]|uniref:uncharacterized protein LOC132938290 n=1 Tax=Metopolophium dirhodum TaxID=44670 RepID=UPI0029904667|nr:uncharacterized protein LOC132938290 [Metopolophium dirhodum]